MRRLTLLLVTLTLILGLFPAASAYPDQAAVTVKVLSPDGFPAAGMSVSLENGNYAILGNNTTGPDGTCSFNVTPGSAAIRALVNGYYVTSVWYEAGNATLEVRLRRIGEVTGTIRLDGMGTGNPLVVLDNGTIFDSTPYDVSRQNGSDIYTFTVNRFSLQTGTGPHSLYAVGYSNGTVYRSGDTEINVSEAGTAVVLELRAVSDNASTLPPAVYDRVFHTSAGGGTFSFSGRLLDSTGAPIMNATLTAQDYLLVDRGSAISGENGTFVFGLLNVSTDFLRLKVSIPDNNSAITSYTQFYPAQGTSGLEVKVLDYPKPTSGYIYGIIALTDNRSNPVPISGTVYLSNGISQEVSPSVNGGQFSFALAPGTYWIYAEHVDGGQRLVSEKRTIEVQAVWSAFAVNPTILVVGPEKVQYGPLALSLALGALCLAGAGSAMRKWL
ncbi:MAG TPA: carboxypeptidase regulatory-like domain-containing protein [Methanocella sp.]|uniref:carboxypeptidase regulatory-like domain-containing protein n=1 Tax=Methanocella sp. TaxID=2052833 RepID=UPI002CF34FEF|nr:carboxypeptidase regulatory-like domain-containing protein [Methanocella sp.]HTY90018.1 carboxypeptidase regulatory-like domain-containing protein [Methanocella sp.]